MDAVGALRLSPLRRVLAIDSTVDIFTFYVSHRHVYGEQWILFIMDRVNPTSTLFPYTTLFRSHAFPQVRLPVHTSASWLGPARRGRHSDRKSTRLNSSHMSISYAVFCLKKKRRLLRDGRRWRSPSFSIASCPCY